MNPARGVPWRKRVEARAPRLYPRARSTLHAARSSVRRVLLRIDPTPAIASRRVPVGATTGTLLCIYRSHNARPVAALVREASAAGLRPKLWALDRVVDSLEVHTVGSGPGGRPELLNRLRAHAKESGTWTVLADDDFEFRRGTLTLLLSIGEAVGLDLLQPAHDSGSFASSAFVLGVPASTARRTSFVEIGPLVAMRSRAAAALLPFEPGTGMGWGEDFRWARLIESNALVAGVVDAVRIRHLARSGTDYDPTPELERRAEALRALGYASSADAQRTFATWRTWRRAPDWSAEQ